MPSSLSLDADETMSSGILSNIVSIARAAQAIIQGQREFQDAFLKTVAQMPVNPPSAAAQSQSAASAKVKVASPDPSDGSMLLLTS